MTTTTLDYVTTSAFLFLAIGMLPIVFLQMRKHKHHLWLDNLTIILTIFIIFMLAIFTNTFYLSIPRESKVDLTPPIVVIDCADDILVTPPYITINYPPSARVGETVEIVLEVENLGSLANIDIYVVNTMTGETIEKEFITVIRGASEMKSFTKTMPEDDFDLEVRVLHIESNRGTKATIRIAQAGMGTASLLLIGALVTTSIIFVVIKKTSSIGPAHP